MSMTVQILRSSKGLKSTLLLSAGLATVAMAPGLARAQDGDPSKVAKDSTVVVVTGIRAALRSAMNVKRDSDKVMDAITAEDIGKFPDKNLSESLQRVTGVQITRQDGEGRGVSIRGADPSLVRTEIDGATALSLTVGGGDRAVDFRDLPVEFVSRLEVVKSVTPDMTEGGLGGTVRVIMRKPFDSKKPFLAASAQGVYSSLAKTYDPKYSLIGSRQFFGGKLGVLASLNYEDRHLYNFKSLTTGWVRKVDLNSDGVLDWTPDIPRPDIERRETTRMAYNTIVQWRPNERMEFYVEGNYAQGHELVNNMLLQLSASSGVVDASKTTLAATPDAIGAYTVSHVELTSDATHSMQLQYRNIDGTLTRTQWDAAVGGKWDVTDRLQVNARYAYSAGKVRNMEKDTQASILAVPRAIIDYNNSQLTPNMSFTDAAGNPLDVTTGALVDRLDATFTPLTDTATESDVKLDLEYHPDSPWLTSVKAGFEAHDTQTRQDLWSRVTTLTSSSKIKSSGKTLVYYSDQASIANIVDTYSGTNKEAFFSGGDLGYSGGITHWNDNGLATWQAILDAAGVTDENSVDTANPNANTGGSYRQWTGNFNVREKTTAFYFQAAFAWPVFGVPMSGVIGDRVIKTDTTSTGFGQTTNADKSLSFPAVAQTGSYTNDLPSLNLKFDLVPRKLIGRFSIGKVMARPAPSQLSFAQTLDVVGLKGSQGNPDLKPYLATNIDLGLESYFSKDGFISAALFEKDISRFIVNTTIPYLANDGQTYSLTMPVNGADRVKVRGLEIGGQYAFSILPAPFDGFGVLGNVTLQRDRGFKGTNLLTGELLPYPGLSRTSYNAGIYYEDAKISTRLSYNWRSRWLITPSGRGGLPEYNDAFGTLDLSLDYNLTKQVTVFVDGTNLTNTAYIQENDPLRRLANETDGSRIFFGVRFKN
ncbi:MAG: TonB-dependent receptor [Asticcacaulis sp.]|uniref:TonB-dependent receptor n=1 Tax=Asticcacaulis sp. TaxID=1872648 RepID=UPI003F7C611A